MRRNFVVTAHLPLTLETPGASEGVASRVFWDTATNYSDGTSHGTRLWPPLDSRLPLTSDHHQDTSRSRFYENYPCPTDSALLLSAPHEIPCEEPTPSASGRCIIHNTGITGTSDCGTSQRRLGRESLSSSLESIPGLESPERRQAAVINWNLDEDIFGAHHALTKGEENATLIGLIPLLTKDACITSEQRETLRVTHNCMVLDIPDSLLLGFQKYCRRILEPIFHSMLPDYHLANYSCADWSSYVRVNEIIAEAVNQEYQEGDLIWIHNYHLFLVPHMIRSTRKNARIGFVLATPFPTSEIFRCLPSRAHILEGMLASNLIGFQAFSFARHFLHSCTRILGLEPSEGGIFQVESERFTRITISPMGINSEFVREQLVSSQVLARLKTLKEGSEGHKIIVGYDRGGALGGIKQKLLALECLLTEYPQWRGQVVLIQIVGRGAKLMASTGIDGGRPLPPTLGRDRVFEALANRVSEINRRFGSLHYTPILLSTDASPPHLYALLQIADVFIGGDLRDGMGLMTHRYVLAQEASGKRSPLLVSEFSGSARSMEEAIRVNPWDSLDFCDAINEALEMSEEERQWRHARLLRRVRAADSQSCSSFFLNELLRVTEEHLRRQLAIIPSLDEFRLKSSFKFSQKPLFILDYDALLPSFRHIPQTLASIVALRTSLQHLATFSNCTIILISGRTSEQLEHTLGEVPAIICAEDGFSCRDEKGVWNDLLPIPDFWDKLSSILEYWTERTPGSWVESKRASFIWHYATAGDFGARQAKECHAHIHDAIGPNYPVQVADTNGEKLSIRLRGLNQRTALSSVLKHYLHSSYDFVAVFLRPREGEMGPSDDLFKFTAEHLARVPCESAPRRAEYIVSVGRASSMAAPWHISDAQSVTRLLNHL